MFKGGRFNSGDGTMEVNGWKWVICLWSAHQADLLAEKRSPIICMGWWES